MNKLNTLVKEDTYLSQITDIRCFNLKALNNKIKFEKSAFYSYIFDYSKNIIGDCQKYGFQYISSRMILRYRGTAFPDQKNKFNYQISFDNKGLSIDDFNSIIDVISRTSRFYKDNKFKKFADKIYKQWIYNSLFNEYSEKIIVLKIKEKIIGFASLKVHRKDCVIDLIGIDEDYQNQGMGSLLLKNAINLFKNYNIIVGTEAENIQALNFYLKNNFKIDKYKLVFHKHT